MRSALVFYLVKGILSHRRQSKNHHSEDGEKEGGHQVAGSDEKQQYSNKCKIRMQAPGLKEGFQVVYFVRRDPEQQEEVRVYGGRGHHELCQSLAWQSCLAKK